MPSRGRRHQAWHEPWGSEAGDTLSKRMAWQRLVVNLGLIMLGYVTLDKVFRLR